MASVEFRNAEKAYGDVKVIHGIDLQLRSGEFIVFVGPSGCGKSTLLRMIAGLEDLTGGSVHIADRDVTAVEAVDRGIAMVFQSYALYPHMTVAQNMGFGLRMNGVDRKEIADKVARAAETLQLSELLDRKPRNLSGGQRQRVAIGRAIVRDPDVFLFDEPLSNLDAELRVEMRLQIARLHNQLDSTMIYVTHDQVEAMTMADRIVVLRDGVVEQVGTPLDLYHHPRNRFVAGFIGSPKMNFLEAELLAVGSNVARVRLQSGAELELAVDSDRAAVGDKVTMGVRPEDLAVTQGEIALTMTADVVERLGGNSFLYGRCEGQDNFVVERSGIDATRSGESVAVYASAASAHLFDADGQAFTRQLAPQAPDQA